MKICVSSVGTNLDSNIDPRFGRCYFFVIVDSETMQFESVPNEATAASGGAGIQAAQTITNKGVEVLITGNPGPNAHEVLSAAGIRAITGTSGTVREAIERYKRGELKEMNSPTVSGHFGMPGGRGSGHGGRGIGRGARGPQGN